MEYNILGKSGIRVSKMCFGTLTLGPLQKNYSVSEGANLLSYAYDKGINFLDTAELYENYAQIKHSLINRPRDSVIIFTKSYAYDSKTAEDSLAKALKELNTDYIDGFLLHEQESEHTLRGHMEAAEFFVRAKEKGYIRTFGVSTHSINCVLASLKYDFIDVIHPLFNKSGIGILDGSASEMLSAIKTASNNGVGIYSMKPLGGGNLIKNYDEALDYVLSVNEIDSIAIGMQSTFEIDANFMRFSNEIIPEKLKENLRAQNRQLIISDWCIGCRECEKVCKQNAINVINGKAVVDKERCVLCSYCAPRCKEFCIKII